ncbi:hypothetical protein [Cryptosporangium aurantiacum]|uniref:Uncharacterized protein n=1 Tax=Cryptosporangium aurantiacum TaxID=134849 RepID=A0A1M7NIJ9_9ACTN|nr:hypothetical protein [Cryptosporangium aurantiacum]SHN03256.1 hypothetical protein SAMN05443668_102637 [Cryptosporangium aurantiacum]
MTEGNTFLQPKAAARAAAELTTIADDLERKLGASAVRIRAIHAKGSQVWGNDAPGDEFLKNYNRGSRGAADEALDATTLYTDVLTDVGPAITNAIDGTVDVDQALGDAIKKLTAEPAGPPPAG